MALALVRDGGWKASAAGEPQHDHSPGQPDTLSVSLGAVLRRADEQVAARARGGCATNVRTISMS